MGPRRIELLPQPVSDFPVKVVSWPLDHGPFRIRILILFIKLCSITIKHQLSIPLWRFCLLSHWHTCVQDAMAHAAYGAALCIALLFQHWCLSSSCAPG